MWVHNLNPTLLQLGPLEIRWYGLVYVLGFLLALWWLQNMRKKGSINLSKEEVWDLGFYVMLGVIIGSRLFEVFWEPAYYLGDPLRLLRIWEGGMSFHGGLVGCVTGAWLFCRKRDVSFWKVADVLSAPAMLALALGRIANFINAELVGRAFSGEWCVIFFPNDECRHPSTLYAAGKRFLIFGWLMWLSLRKTFKAGFIFWNLVFWEGLGRFIVDFYREDALHYGFSLGQWFSAVMVVVALCVFVYWYKEDWKKLLSSK